MIRSSKATARAAAADQRHAAKVRTVVMDVRDLCCRAANKGLGPCEGVPEWAHLGDKRRCFTRKMAPADRHDARWTMKLCTRHHRLYDQHVFEVEYVNAEDGANGRCRFVSAQAVVSEV